MFYLKQFLIKFISQLKYNKKSTFFQIFLSNFFKNLNFYHQNLSIFKNVPTLNTLNPPKFQFTQHTSCLKNK